VTKIYQLAITKIRHCFVAYISEAVSVSRAYGRKLEELIH